MIWVSTASLTIHFTLIGDELDQRRNKSSATLLGFAVLLKFLLWRGPRTVPARAR